MNTHTRNEKGIALIVSIMAIIVIGGLLVGVATAARLEHRQAQNTGELRQAFAVTELGLAEATASWNAGDWNALDPLATADISGTAPGDAGTYAGVIRRLNTELFLVDVTGTSASGLARQRLGTFVKLVPLDVEIEASLTTRGSVRRSGNGIIDGRDQSPAGWNQCSPPVNKAGVRIPDASDVNPSNCPSCIRGQPPVDEDPTIDDATFFEFGNLGWDGLVALANQTGFQLNNPPVGPRLTGSGECDVDDPNNWGDPLNLGAPCSEFFPVIYAAGDLTLNVGSGQGVLIVDGDLNVQGNFEFYGIVIVRGRLATAGQGAGDIHFRGAVMAANVDLSDNRVAGNARIQYSSCVVHRAQLAAAMGTPLRSRGWVQGL